MIPLNVHREIESSGETACADFGLSEKDSAHLMCVLRDTIYSDKVLAVLREYGANAWDAHRMVGKNDLPISVTLPTHEDPVLRIVDYGPGLSHLDVFSVFTKYGASTKRGDNAAVGMLGIGCKAGFAYNDSFNVISKHNGVGRSYNAALDPSNRGQLRLMDEFECGDETGLTIEIPVRSRDITDFHTKAKSLFQFFVPQPKINTELDPVPIVSHSSSGVVTGYDSFSFDWKVVMGCIAYPIQLSQISIPYCFGSTKGVIYVEVGALSFSASREALKYDDNTKRSIEASFKNILNDYQKHVLLELDRLPNDWQRRLMFKQFHKLAGFVNTPLKSPRVSLDEKLTGYKFGVLATKRLHKTIDFEINANRRFILRNDKRAIEGYGFTKNDIILRGSSNEKDIATMLDLLKIGGIPFFKTSDMPWNKPSRPSYYKKRSKCYEFMGRDKGKDIWEAVTIEQMEDTLYVVIPDFRTESVGSTYFTIKEFLTSIGEPMPKLYCFKKKEDVKKGVPFSEWCSNVFIEMCNKYPSLDTLRRNWVLFTECRYMDLKDTAEFIEKIGAHHVLSVFLKRLEQARVVGLTAVEPFAKNKHPEDLAALLHSNYRSNVKTFDDEFAPVQKEYPLLSKENLVGILKSPEWIEYLQLWKKVKGE